MLFLINNLGVNTGQEIPNDAEVSVGLTSDGTLGTRSLVTTLKRYSSLCDITSCPVAPGSIVLTFSNIFIPQDLLHLIGVSILFYTIN